MTPRACVRWFESRFAALGSPEHAVNERAYMKSALRFHGVDAKQLRAGCAAFCEEQPDIDRERLLAFVDALFATDWFDLRSAAIVLLERKRKLLRASDSPWLVGMARQAACWAHVDYLSTAVVAHVVAGDPALAKRVRGWAKDGSFWVRRVALLSLLPSLRRGGGDFALFTEIAAPMVEEREFFIRKAFGWVLREVSKKRPGLVVQFLEMHGERCSGLTRREATKYLRPAAPARRRSKAGR